MDESIVIPKFRLLPEDFNILRARRGILVAAMMAIIATLGAIGLATLLGYKRESTLTCLIVAPPLVFLGIYFRGTATAKQAGNENLLREREIVLSPSGLTQTVEGGVTTFVPWPMVYKVTDTPRYFMLYFTAAQYFVIPRRVLTPEMERQILTFFYQKGLLKPHTR